MSEPCRRVSNTIYIIESTPSMLLFHIKKALFFAAIILLTSGQAFGKEYPKTESDFRKLPKYCLARMKGGDANYWNKKLPGIYEHIHHFCAAIHSYQHASNMFPSNKNDRQTQKHFFERVLGNISYLESHVANKNHRIFSEMYYLKAKAMVELKQTSSAIVYFEKAISVNKKYTKSYVALARLYVKLGQKKKAGEIVDRGLEVKPESKSLGRLKKEL